MKVLSPILLIRLILIFLEIQFSSSQQQNCDNSCLTCSSNKISQCTSCQSSYFFLNQENKCVQNCPEGTYLDQDTKKCITCASKYCKQCSQTTCFKCKSGFLNDKNNPVKYSNLEFILFINLLFCSKKANCISDCSLQGQLLNEKGQCDFSCSSDDQYEVDHSSNGCIITKPCSLLKKIPELQNKSDIIARLFDNTQQFIISIDALGNVVIYNYPELKIWIGYSLKLTSSNIVDCNYVDDSALQQQIITCLQSPISVLQFYAFNGTIIKQTYINDRIFTKSLDLGRDWNLFIAQKDKYELYIIKYSTLTYYIIDNFNYVQILAMIVKKEAFSFPFDIMTFNYIDGTLNYFQFLQSSYRQNSAFSSGIVDLNAKLIQLKSYDFWVLYTNNGFNLLKFNSNTLQLALKQNTIVDEKLQQIYLTSITQEVFFVIGNSNQYSLQIKLMQFDVQKENISQGQKEMYNSQFNNVNYLYIFSETVITCSAQSINVYQLSLDNSYLKYLTKLKEDNPKICSFSNFSVTKIGTTTHVWQKFQRNLKVNTFDTLTQKYFQSFIANFADTDQSMKKFTSREKSFNLLIENYENQLLFEFKTYGLVYMYDIIKKSIINQVRIWYPQHETTSRVLFNFVQMKDNEYLFAGFERLTFKLKIINVKTLEISYEQEIPEINFSNYSELRIVYSPIYFNLTDSIVIPIQMILYTTDIQRKFDFHFLQKNTNSSISSRYKYVSQLSVQGKNYIPSIATEHLILFYLVDFQNTIYQFIVYNKSGIKVYTSSNYVQRDENNLGQVYETVKKAYIGSYSYLQIFNLDTLKMTSISYKCVFSYSFNKNFNLLYVQDSNSCQPSNEGIYTYVDSPQLKKATPAKNSYFFKYYWYNDYLIFASTTTTLYFYDGSLIWNLTSIHGINIGGFVQERQVVYFNSQAISHYDMLSQKLLFAEVNMKSFIF